MSTLMREVNFLRSEIQSLKTRVSSLTATQISDSTLREEVSNLRLSLSELRSESQPTSSSYNIPKPHTIQHKLPNPNITLDGINIAAWNCHSLANSVPYLLNLADNFDIIPISEQWMWPYELPNLDTLLPGYKGFGCSDKWPTECSELVRGCGGVALLWRSSLPVTPVTTLNSDRITAVQVSINSSTSLSVIGVYLPTSDNPIDVYREYISELEIVVSIYTSSVWSNHSHGRLQRASQGNIH